MKQRLSSLGIHVEVLSGYRLWETQERIWNESAAAHGEAHTERYVAKSGYSWMRSAVFAGEARGLDGEDLSKCLFFNGPWEDEIVFALYGWKNLAPQRNESQERPAIRLQSDSAIYSCETNGAS